MTIKQAMICNLISSLLCLIGVLIGLAIGSAHDTAPWIFASTGGMRMYHWLFVTLYAKSTDKMPRQHTSNPKIPKVSKAIGSPFY